MTTPLELYQKLADLMAQANEIWDKYGLRNSTVAQLPEEDAAKIKDLYHQMDLISNQLKK